VTSSADPSSAIIYVSTDVIPAERIESRIFLIRGQKVLLDRDLAEFYGVETRALNQAVSRNPVRFPGDFRFALTREEIGRISQIGTSSKNLKFSKSVNAFTEQGVAMLSGLLNSPRAIAVNVGIMRAFVRLRQMIAGHADLARKLAALEDKYDAQFKVVFDAIRELMEPPAPAKSREMGFHTGIPQLSRQLASTPPKPVAPKRKALSKP
jgi:hypothetical protein